MVHLDKIEVPPVFKVIKDVGGVPEEDMINNLNIGMGMIMVTSPRQETAMIQYLGNKGIHTYHIGEIIPMKTIPSNSPVSLTGNSLIPY